MLQLRVVPADDLPPIPVPRGFVTRTCGPLLLVLYDPAVLTFSDLLLALSQAGDLVNL